MLSYLRLHNISLAAALRTAAGGCRVHRPGRHYGLLAVPNVTAHPSTASVPTTYYSMWHCTSNKTFVHACVRVCFVVRCVERRERQERRWALVVIWTSLTLYPRRTCQLCDVVAVVTSHRRQDHDVTRQRKSAWRLKSWSPDVATDRRYVWDVYQSWTWVSSTYGQFDPCVGLGHIYKIGGSGFEGFLLYT